MNTTDYHRVFELNIILIGLSNEYLSLIKNKILAKINPQTNQLLPWHLCDLRDNQFDFNEIKSSIISNDGRPELPNSKVVVLCGTESISSESSLLLMKSILALILIEFPFVIYLSQSTKDNQFSLNEFKEKLLTDEVIKTQIDVKQIDCIYHNQKDPSELSNKLFEICNYYNELGDLYKFPGAFNEEYNQHHQELFSMNLLVVGPPGAGKSTFINILLNENKAYAGNGFSHTKHINKYFHKKYPLVIYDTPGIEETNKKQVIQFIINNLKINQSLFRNQIHIIVYMKNIRTRNLLETEKDFLVEMGKFTIPIFYLLTNADINLNSKKEISDKISIFIKDYNQYIWLEQKQTVFPMNLLKPYYNITEVVNGLVKFMLQYSLFSDYLRRLDDNSIKFETVRNEIFEILSQYQSITTTSLNTPEVKRKVAYFLNNIYVIYNIKQNSEWNKVIEQRAKDNFLNPSLRNRFTEHDIIKIKKEINNKIDFSNYLTYIAIFAYQIIEENIRKTSNIFNKSQFVFNYFERETEKMMTEMRLKYKEN